MTTEASPPERTGAAPGNRNAAEVRLAAPTATATATRAHDATDLPDAESLFATLADGVRGLLTPRTLLVGIASGGVWLAERLQAALGLEGAPGVISSAMHRDDFAQRGMAASAQRTTLPFEVDGADVILLDDVLYTGRTIRAVLNELFDYGRPASVKLAVLVDRGGRELPVQADFAAARAEALPADQQLALAQDASGRLSLHLETVGT